MPFSRGRRIVGGWCSLLALLLLATTTHATERRYYFDTIGSERGLTSHTVTALFQDRTGYLWIGTQAGLNRYDGYGFRLFQYHPQDPDSLPEAVVTALAQDAQGRLWVGGLSQGLAALDEITGKVVSHSRIGIRQSLSRDAIGALAFDPARGLWIGTAAGIELMNPVTLQRRELYSFSAGSRMRRVFQFAPAADGAMWAATSAGLLRFAPHSDLPQSVAP